MANPTEYTIIHQNEYPNEELEELSKESEVSECNCTKTSDCGDTCINRITLVECNSTCKARNCSNKRFQQRLYANVEVFETTNRGRGVRASQNIPRNTFIMEYVGEVIPKKDFAELYYKNYLMHLNKDLLIDSKDRLKGNDSRYMNHSCQPNCETQKWIVNNQCHIGIFTVENVQANEELTIDYGWKGILGRVIPCKCRAINCNGSMG